jgi:hypothetical protein
MNINYLIYNCLNKFFGYFFGNFNIRCRTLGRHSKTNITKSFFLSCFVTDVEELYHIDYTDISSNVMVIAILAVGVVGIGKIYYILNDEFHLHFDVLLVIIFAFIYIMMLPNPWVVSSDLAQAAYNVRLSEISYLKFDAATPLSQINSYFLNESALLDILLDEINKSQKFLDKYPEMTEYFNRNLRNKLPNEFRLDNIKEVRSYYNKRAHSYNLIMNYREVT